MKLLVIDTCGVTGSIALAEDAAGVGQAAILGTAVLPGRTASERLVPAIDALLTGCRMSLQSLDAVAVVHGPGSFTGIRIGLSAAKGLCEALAIPLVAVSRLAVLVEMAADSSLLATGLVRALLDAGRGEFYCGEYVDGVCVREALVGLEAARLGLADERTVVVCEATVAAALTSQGPKILPEPTASDAVPIALRRAREARFDDIAAIDANYVRRTDAEIFAKPKTVSL